MTRRRLLPALILIVGLAQMTADRLGAPRLAALFLATSVSPAPKVFTTQAGYEAFSTSFVLEVREADGSTRALAITPERYARVLGPYNRRNALGAAIAGAPLLHGEPLLAPMLDGVAVHALCGEGRLLRELGHAPRAKVVAVRLRFRTRPGVVPPQPVEVTCPA